MREVTGVFEQGFKVGLRPFTNISNSVEYMYRAYNLVPNQYGIEGRQEVINPVQNSYQWGWPWPLITIHARHPLFFDAQSVYRILDDWTVDHIYTSPNGWGGIPHFADFMDTLIWSTPNGSWMYANGQVTPYPGGADFRTCINFAGQLLIGDGKLPNGPKRVSNSQVKEEAILNETEVIPNNPELMVAWSKVGSLDWTFDLGNEVGFAPMPWMGKVLKLLTLGNRVVAYGTNGIAQLAPETTPTLTYGIHQWGDIGILNRDCVAGDGTMHIFIGKDLNLYAAQPERALSAEGRVPQLLGYKEYISKLSNPIVTFDPVERHWWIGDTNNCFILSSSGMGEANITPTYLSRYEGQLIGSYFVHGDERAIAITGESSFNNRDMKTLMTVQADIRTEYTARGSVWWRSDYKKEHKPTRLIRLDPRGFFFPVCSGTELKVELNIESFKNLFLGKLWLRFKHTDKSSSRGVINAGAPEQ